MSTSIATLKPRPQVIGGHNCAFVPFNRFACDQLQTTVLPQADIERRYDDFDAFLVPEPTSLALLGLGSSALLRRRR